MSWWVSPFGHPRIKAWEATPRGLSQPPTSFIGFRRQGIHRWLFVAWKNKDARARYEILKGRLVPAAEPRRARHGKAAIRPKQDDAVGTQNSPTREGRAGRVPPENGTEETDSSSPATRGVCLRRGTGLRK
jgi:hypothetical protein